MPETEYPGGRMNGVRPSGAAPESPPACAVPAVDVRGLSFSFEAEEVLSDITLTVPGGEVLALIGPNGGGKTTLLRMMLGVLSPLKGEVLIWGKQASLARRNIGYVPQYATVRADFPATVLELTLMGAARPSARGGSWGTGKAARELAMHHLAALGLAEVARHQVGCLSGGQQQRALAARALMGRPRETEEPFLLLLDEPTASIDPQGQFCFYDFLNELRGNVTIVVVSHDVMLASSFFTSVVFVNRTLTRLPGGPITPESLVSLYGPHHHPCPVADLQHWGGLIHRSGCTHPSCASPDARDVHGGGCATSSSLQPESVPAQDAARARQAEPS